MIEKEQVRLQLPELRECSICLADFASHDHLIIHAYEEHGMGFVPQVVKAASDMDVVQFPKSWVGKTVRLEKVWPGAEVYDLVIVMPRKKRWREV